MIVKNLSDVPKTDMPGLDGVQKQIPIGFEDGSNEIVLRYFTLAPQMSSPHHAHDFPHLIRVERGQGYLTDSDGNKQPVRAGQFIYVGDNETHCITNTGDGDFEFICVVPARGE